MPSWHVTTSCEGIKRRWVRRRAPHTPRPPFPDATMASLSALPVLAARALPASRRASPFRAVAPARRVAPPAPLISERARGVTAAAARVACRASSEDDDDYELSADDLEFMDGEFVVEAFDDDAQLAKALVMEVQENAKACIDERGAFVMAVPGGSVAKALAGLKDVTDVDWSKVHLFFVNERTPEGKCFKLATDVWVGAVDIPPENVHRCGEGTPADEASAYEAQMRNLPSDILPIDEVNGLPVFDLILLGMGADGHVGSIYPDSDALRDESGAAVLGVDMPSKRSITASLALINTAERVVVAASGVGKAETVRAALEDEECELPGAMVDAFSTIWFLDAGAASKLQAYADAEFADEE